MKFVANASGKLEEIGICYKDQMGKLKEVSCSGNDWDLVVPVDKSEHMGYFQQLLEAGRDKGSEWTQETAQWILVKLGEIFKQLGLWLLDVAPDTLIIMAMICTLGAIASIPKMGKWAAGSVAAALLFEIVRGSVTGA